MKRAICLVLAALLCAAFAACAAEGGDISLRFEEGFSLALPQGWVSYPPAEGVRYILGDGTGARYLYILAEPSEFETFEDMQAAIAGRENCQATSALDLDGQRFAAFIAQDLNASGCAALLNGERVTFLFTPHDDPDYMLTVAEIMTSFRMD